MGLVSRIIGTQAAEWVWRHRRTWRDEQSFRKWRDTPHGQANINQLRELKQRHQGRRAFVIGNGPSLNETPINALAKEITIGCNGLFLLFDKMGWVPTYYTVEDPLVAQDRGGRIAGIAGTTRIVPLDLQAQITGGSTLWVNFLRQYPGFPKFSNSFEDRVYWGGTVTYFNIQLAVHLGCNPIILVGCDHSYATDFKIQKEGVVWTSQGHDQNHFHPDYFGKGYRWHDPNVPRMEQAYLHALNVTRRMGVQVFNATVGGKLEVFPRADIHTLVGARKA
jgi:hypothetical protein